MTSPADPRAAAATLLSGLDGQRVLVTGGASGIGLVVAETLVALGARVAVCDVSDDALERARAAVDLAAAVRADVADEADVDRLFEAVAGDLGGLDALVNNAGIAGPTGAIEDLDLAEWRRCLDVGLTGQFLCARRAVPLLKAEGGGAIVVMASVAGKLGYAFRTPYAAAKFGVVGLALSLAKELGPHGIRVNALLPGIVEGPRMDEVIVDRAAQTGTSVEAMTERYLANISLRRMTSPRDVAGAVAFLLSDAGRNLSGQQLCVDGNVEAL